MHTISFKLSTAKNKLFAPQCWQRLSIVRYCPYIECLNSYANYAESNNYKWHHLLVNTAHIVILQKNDVLTVTSNKEHLGLITLAYLCYKNNFSTFSWKCAVEPCKAACNSLNSLSSIIRAQTHCNTTYRQIDDRHGYKEMHSYRQNCLR